jgi:hypothetical protein
VKVAESRKAHFKSGTNAQATLDKALKQAQIAKLYASAAKDRQDVRDSIQQSFDPPKKL